MFTFFVFRRFGLAVPVTLMLVGILVQHVYDQSHGPGYYSSHFTPVGLTLFLTGVLTGIISCVVVSSSTSTTTASSGNNLSSSSGKYSSLLVDHGDSSSSSCSPENIQTLLRTKMEQFVYESTNDDTDTFCYIPLNRCSQVLMGVGVVVMIAGMFQ